MKHLWKVVYKDCSFITILPINRGYMLSEVYKHITTINGRVGIQLTGLTTPPYFCACASLCNPIKEFHCHISWSFLGSVICMSCIYQSRYVVLGKWDIVHKGVYFTMKHVKRVHIRVDAHFIDKIEKKNILDPSAGALYL